MESTERNISVSLDPAGNVGRIPMAASTAKIVRASERRNPKFTQTCCGITSIPAWQPYLSGDGDTVYIIVYECLKCHQTKF